LRPDPTPLRTHLRALARAVASGTGAQQTQRRTALATLNAQLELLNPQRTLARGYAVVTDARGAILRSPAQLQPRQSITLRLAEGSAEVAVASVQVRADLS
jgi:exodeoxyribonuclease VII large subunit